MEIETANIHQFTIECKTCGHQGVAIKTTHSFTDAEEPLLITISCQRCDNTEDFEE